MNYGDVFILDIGVVLFVWVGKEVSRIERIKVRNCRYFFQEKYYWNKSKKIVIFQFYKKLQNNVEFFLGVGICSLVER